MGVGRFAAETQEVALQGFLGRLGSKKAGLGMEAVAAGQISQCKVVMGLAPPGSRTGLTHGRACTQRDWAWTARQWGEGESARACQRKRSRANTSSPTRAVRS